MPRTKKVVSLDDTLWTVTDALWTEIAPVFAELDPRGRRGPERTPPRPILDAVLYHLRTGCQWNRLPREFPDDSTVHRNFQRWVVRGVFERIWATLVEHCDDLAGVDWRWQAVDGVMGKARHGGDAVGPNPTDRGKKRDEAQRSRRRAGRAAGRRGGRRERARHQAARSDA